MSPDQIYVYFIVQIEENMFLTELNSQGNGKSQELRCLFSVLVPERLNLFDGTSTFVGVEYYIHYTTDQNTFVWSTDMLRITKTATFTDISVKKNGLSIPDTEPGENKTFVAGGMQVL